MSLKLSRSLADAAALGYYDSSDDKDKFRNPGH